MFPNQPPPTSTTAAAGTSQTATTTAQSATSATLTAAIVGAANTASMPETTAAPVLPPQAVQQGAQRTQRTTRRASQGRAQPYQRRAPATQAQATASLPQAQVTAAAQGYQRRRGESVSGTTQAGSSAATMLNTFLTPLSNEIISLAHCQGSKLAPLEGNAVCEVESLKEFFGALSMVTGIEWTNSYTAIPKNTVEATDKVTNGAIASSELSFSEQYIEKCISPELKELFLRVNAEKQAERRAFLLVKAMRAFNEANFLWHGALTNFGFFLGVNSNAVASWGKTLPNNATAVARTHPAGAAATLPLTLRLPVDVLSKAELMRVLQERLSLVRTQVSTTDQTETSSSTEAGSVEKTSIMELSFSEDFIGSQVEALGEMMRTFNQENNNEKERNRLLANIVCVLKDSYGLPPDIFSCVCEMLEIKYSSASNWFSRNRSKFTSVSATEKQAAVAPVFTPPIQALPSSSAPAAPPEVAQVHPLFFPPSPTIMASASASMSALSAKQAQPPVAAISSAQGTLQTPVSPIFTASTAPSTSAAVQLAPVLPPFTADASPQSLGMTMLDDDDDDDVQVAPISPVFPGPFSPPAIDTSAYSTAQLAPTLQQVTPAAPSPSLEDLLALPIVRDPSMEMDVDEILWGLDFDLDI